MAKLLTHNTLSIPPLPRNSRSVYPCAQWSNIPLDNYSNEARSKYIKLMMKRAEEHNQAHLMDEVEQARNVEAVRIAFGAGGSGSGGGGGSGGGCAVEHLEGAGSLATEVQEGESH